MDNLLRDFKGVWIPKEIWLDTRLNALDKIILLEIDSLDVGEDGCYASNQYLADFCQCTETKISTAVSKLIKLQYLEAVKFDGRKRFLKSRLKKNEKQTLKNLKADFKKFNDINIINNINNNKYNIFIKPTLQEVTDYCKERNNNVDPQRFIDFYESKGWMVGKNKMKDWRACVRTWERRTNNMQEVIGEPVWFNETLKNEDITLEEKNEIENILNEIGE